MCDTNTPSTTRATTSNSGTASSRYSVQGMTCTSCAAKVAAAVEQATSGATTEVDLATGTLTVAGADLDNEAIRTAIHQAGYHAI